MIEKNHPCTEFWLVLGEHMRCVREWSLETRRGALWEHFFVQRTKNSLPLCSAGSVARSYDSICVHLGIVCGLKSGFAPRCLLVLRITWETEPRQFGPDYAPSRDFFFPFPLSSIIRPILTLLLLISTLQEAHESPAVVRKFLLNFFSFFSRFSHFHAI